MLKKHIIQMWSAAKVPFTILTVRKEWMNLSIFALFVDDVFIKLSICRQLEGIQLGGNLRACKFDWQLTGAKCEAAPQSL